MALIVIASDKGAPGVTTAALALAAVWPRPVLLAECDQAGGDLVYRFPAAGGGHLDPRRGVLSLAVVARRGMQPQQVWEHVQKLHGGLDVLAGVTNAEQGAGLSLLWGPIGRALAALPQADVIADCGRLGADGPLYDLLIEATTVVLVSKVQVADVIRLRDRAAAFATAAQSRGRRGFGVGVVVVAEPKKFRAALGEVQHVLGQAHAPATVLGGIAHDPKGANLLGGEWGGSLDRTMLIKTARDVAQQLVQGLPPIGDQDAAPPGYPAGPYPGQPAPAPPAMTPPAMTPPPPAGRRHAAPPIPSSPAEPAPAAAYSGPQPAFASYPGPQGRGPQGTGPQGTVPAGPWQGGQEPSRQDPGWPEPRRPEPGHPPVPASVPVTPDLAAVTLSAPTAAGPTTPGPAVSAPAGPPPANTAPTSTAPTSTAPASTAPASTAPTSTAPTSTGPAFSVDAPRTTFSRVLGSRGGRHQGAQPPSGSPSGGVQGQGGTRPARHAAPASSRPGGSPVFTRPPMPPLAPLAETGSENTESADDPGWGTAPWQRPGPMGAPGAARPGGE